MNIHQMKPDEAVARTALALRAQAPHAWDSFCQAMNMMREHHDDQLAEAPADSLHKAQGYAACTRYFLRIFMNAPDLVRKYDQGKTK